MLDQNIYNQFKLKYPLESLKAAGLREKAFQAFVAQGFPTKKEEAWKFTSLTEAKAIDWNIALEESMLSHDEMVYVSKQLSSDFYNVVFVNGFLNKTLSDSDVPIEFKDLEETDFNVANDFPDLKLINLSRGFGFQKAVINIDKKSQLDKPLQIVHVASAKASTMVQSIVQVNVADTCELKLIQHTLGLTSQLNNQHAFNADLQVNLGKAANVKFANLQNANTKDFSFGRIQFSLSQDSQLTSLDLALGSKTSRHYLATEFTAENANAGVYGLTLLADEQHCDQYTYVHHKIGHNNSTQHYKSILTDKAQSVFRGRVRIEQDAQKANSEQLNNNLLISKAAQATSIPQLEIYADDVKAGHGSTVGQLNKDEIFYFLSRGISEKKAVQLLTHGFAKELVYKLENEVMENFVFQTLESKLNEIF
ncbi:Fe-S cluster assembly protein SufD [Pseudobdellovibrio sp. HCB154]|uniref:Fe-S cluster assembly protein SufD n=1 Tax=Pseudobdellovibrio sp. HCB154 TaxID=3386277 RepID=UPI0039174FE3